MDQIDVCKWIVKIENYVSVNKFESIAISKSGLCQTELWEIKLYYYKFKIFSKDNTTYS